MLLVGATTKASSQNGQRPVAGSGTRTRFSGRAVSKKVRSTTRSFSRMSVLVVLDAMVMFWMQNRFSVR